ncbi:hypothetical protein YN1_6280 [Nanoarchaeota archaeon]
MENRHIKFIRYFLRYPYLTSKYLFYKKILKKEEIKYKGLIIKSALFYDIVEKRIKLNKIEKISEYEFIYEIPNLGKFYVKDSNTPAPMDQLSDYNILNVKDKVVLDIGAYIGDSAIYFIRRGAKKVYAYEAVKEFYEIMLKNIELNNLQDKIISISYGVDCSNGKNYINLGGEASGLKEGDIEINLKSIKDIFEEIYKKEGEFITKIDCEGCEYSLLCLPDEMLKYSKEYIIEIHGSPQTIISKFTRNGYKFRKVHEFYEWIKVYYFYL